MAITRTDRDQTFDPQGRIVSDVEVIRDITLQVVEKSVIDKIRASIAGNIAALGQLSTAIENVDSVIASTPTTVAQCNTAIDNLAQVVKKSAEQSGRMMRQITAMERLLIGSDLLQTDDGT